MVEALLAKGADVNRAQKYGWTPLLMAAKKGHVKVVSALLAKGADVNQVTKNGATPLSIAKAKGHTTIVELIENYLRTH